VVKETGEHRPCKEGQAQPYHLAGDGLSTIKGEKAEGMHEKEKGKNKEGIS